MPMKSLFIATAQRIRGTRPSPLRAAASAGAAGTAVGVGVSLAAPRARRRLATREREQDPLDPVHDLVARVPDSGDPIQQGIDVLVA